MILARVEDLYFASRIEVAANHVGCRVIFIPAEGAGLNLMGTAYQAPAPAGDEDSIDPEQLGSAALLLVDLNQPGAVEAIRNVRANPVVEGLLIVAFGSHVDTETLAAARAGGADRAVARSRFVEILPDLIEQAANRDQ